MTKYLARLKRQLIREEKRINLLGNLGELSVHGYYSLGYYESKVSSLEDMIEELEAIQYRDRYIVRMSLPLFKLNQELSTVLEDIASR